MGGLRAFVRGSWWREEWRKVEDGIGGIGGESQETRDHGPWVMDRGSQKVQQVQLHFLYAHIRVLPGLIGDVYIKYRKIHPFRPAEQGTKYTTFISDSGTTFIARRTYMPLRSPM